MNNDFRNSENENNEMKETEEQSYELEEVFEESKESEEALSEEDKENQEGLGQKIQKDQEGLGQEVQKDQKEISQEDQEVQTQGSQVCEAKQEGYKKEDKESPQSTPIIGAPPYNKTKRGKGRSVAIIVLLSSILVALALIAAMLLPTYGGGLLGRLTGNDKITVVKNDGSIKVNESTGEADTLTLPQVVAKVADTVVEIRTKHTAGNILFGTYETTGAGSGVIISENGYILTNCHVVEGADEIAVRLTNGKTYSAQLIGSNASVDIAVVKIKESGLNYARMGSSASLSVGQSVVAIGNPLGTLGGTVTNGIISAKDREVIIDRYRMTLLQTNAAINPGNSGGGLFDMAGQLIGIVNAKKIDEQIEGLGFAIPIDIAWAAAEKIIKG